MSQTRKMDKEYLKELATDIMLKLSDEEIEEILSTEESIERRFEKVTSINTDGIEPQFYPFEESHTYLREDDEFYSNDQKDLLKNAPTVDGDFITIVKVVK